MGCKCELKNCALLENGKCCSTSTIPCKSVPEQFLDHSASAHNSDYAKCPTCKPLREGSTKSDMKVYTSSRKPLRPPSGTN
jgi:hypothetical protein